MSEPYKKRNMWYIDYFLGKKKITKNTKLPATETNRVKAKKLALEIKQLLKEQNQHRVSTEEFIIGEISLDKAIREFKETHIIGKSAKHEEIFDYVMRKFKTQVPGTTNVKNIRNEDITRFALMLKREMAQATQVTYFQYLASFLSFLKERKYINEVPNFKGIRPKKAVKNIISFDPTDLKTILEEAKKTDIKYYNAFMMFLLTGQRPGDVLRLKIHDIDFHRKILYFRISKTNSEFKFPIYEKLERFLRDELRVSEKSAKDELLLPKLTVKSVGIVFRKIKHSLGFNRKQYYTLKTFRKNFATEMSRKMTIQDVQALLDHKSPSTTLRYYADVRADELKNKIDKINSEIC